jgi:hypothetical protein
MRPSIEHARREVEDAFQRALEVAESREARTLLAVETSLWMLLLALGRSLVGLYLAHQVARPRAACYTHNGIQYELSETDTRRIAVRFGKVPFARPVGRAVGCPWAARDFPVDRELGLSGSFSLLVIVTLVKMCTQMAFAPARKGFRDIFAWSPSTRSTLRMVDAVGKEARPFLEQAPAPQQDGEVMNILVDGKGAPTISSRERARRARPHRKKGKGTRRHERRHRRREYPRARRKPGKKSKNAKVAAVAVIYTQHRTADGSLEGPINKRVYATFSSYRAVFEWILREATKRGYGTSKITKLVFSADGADVLWDLQQEYFPDAEVCLDWFHVTEKLWKVGKCLHRPGTRKLADWVAQQKKRLRRGQLAAILAELETHLSATGRTGPGTKHRRKVLEKTLNHFRKNACRMKYHRLRRQDLDIGTGIVEGAVRHLVGVRLDGPGMRWGRDRAEMILHLRCILLNGQWDDFVSFLAAKHQLALLPQPIPARTHDAKAAA